ncbi:DeoR/GlpR family DNA-binding transcription regulator [Staphylococcus saccharolyticus]|nr:DeoR/GlpR family DNA-binding transcription regulator [Staphylococcus saccharolyticus]MBL7565777.1 DeoR/GlpR transcriptional regulator [Staphylococcus saccharolyticus]MBL7572141.1 DeoR/GlpR transcriptional regulator [Staphylococcus saccharolyticus]QQB97699.1 DeoR/GlpR transcriptional regulator [Staphylococcus saccharolyticus]QRJ66445.1 DeoR/GlpR transcriptional regulator [Staphylococcus saccharolyticus]RTX94830.1 DeoR/GlpR transcriptional regulator [Staphylococcus saccharolyticus]
MISEKRQTLILQELAQKDFLTLQELIDRTGCSASTIRRDLSKLQKIGKLQRVHGGATLNQNRVVEPGLSEKLTKNLREKQEIAKQAAQEIQDKECIFLDAGSSTFEMIQYIDAKDIIVVTNGMTHVEELLKHGIKMLMIGGQVKATTMATVGANALETLRRYCFDRAFIGMNGIDLKYGLTTPDEQEALIKETAMKLSNEKYILVDQSKFNQVYFARVPLLDSTILITSQKALKNKVTDAYKTQFYFLGGKS